MYSRVVDMCMSCQAQAEGERRIWTDLDIYFAPANLLCVLLRRASKMGWRNKIKYT